MKKILITGGNGFIGRYLYLECKKRNLDYLSISNLEPVDIDHERKVDILDKDGIRAILSEYRPDAIIHLAAIASPVHEDIAEIYRVNVGGTENLLLSATEVLPVGTRVILTSTAGVYGNQPTKYLYEELPFNPVNHYSFSKMITEILSRQYMGYLDIHIVRPFNIVGIGQKENFLVPKLVKHFVNRTEVIELGNMNAYRDYVSVEFCAKVFISLATQDSPIPKVLNICTGRGYSCQEVVDILKKITGFSPRIITAKQLVRKNEIWSLIGDTRRLEAVVGDEYWTFDLEAMLYNMLNAYEARL